jgi:hypothetical protein
VEQNRGPMDKKRIRGLPGRTSEQPIAKSITIKDRGGRSDGRAVKAADLTSGGLRCVPQSGLRSPQGGLTAAQKSAEGVVGGTSFAEGLNDGRTLGHGDLEPAMRPNKQVTGFCSDGKG